MWSKTQEYVAGCGCSGGPREGRGEASGLSVSDEDTQRKTRGFLIGDTSVVRKERQARAALMRHGTTWLHFECDDWWLNASPQKFP